MSLEEFHTQRLRAVPVATLSAKERSNLLEADVVRWLPAFFHDLGSDADRQALLQTLSQEADVIALANETGQRIGLIILSHAVLSHSMSGESEVSKEEVPVRHLGYLFAQQAWGKGYATEMLAGLQKVFRGQRVRISGGVMQENAASARVLQKAGFRRGAETQEGEVTYVWEAMG